ncbi:MAG: hypothetical protein J6C91_07370, partial [Muribaculaceae bacterium]|nr:hypothetical protein [Muribaculaceae bacterium]
MGRALIHEAWAAVVQTATEDHIHAGSQRIIESGERNRAPALQQPNGFHRNAARGEARHHHVIDHILCRYHQEAYRQGCEKYFQVRGHRIFRSEVRIMSDEGF